MGLDELIGQYLKLRSDCTEPSEFVYDQQEKFIAVIPLTTARVL